MHSIDASHATYCYKVVRSMCVFVSVCLCWDFGLSERYSDSLCAQRIGRVNGGPFTHTLRVAALRDV